LKDIDVIEGGQALNDKNDLDDLFATVTADVGIAEEKASETATVNDLLASLHANEKKEDDDFASLEASFLAEMGIGAPLPNPPETSKGSKSLKSVSSFAST
jgi:hypothetical protein